MWTTASKNSLGIWAVAIEVAPECEEGYRPIAQNLCQTGFVSAFNLHGQLMAAQDLFRRVSPRPSDGEKDKAENEFKEIRKTFLVMASEARPPYEDVEEEYEKLSEESAVSNALKAHNQLTKANFKMGPSDKLNKDVADVKRYEQVYSPETAPRPTKMTKPSLKKKK